MSVTSEPAKPRQATVKRKTKETRITVSLRLDGEGRARLDLAEPYLIHMLETLAKYAGFDLEISASGDRGHHLIEDVALTLGRALREAMGEVPVTRIAHAVVPMDEALVLVAVDLIDRPFAEVDALPDRMYSHFLRSFATEGRFALHLSVLRGLNDHHIIEAGFKALGLSLRQALARSRTVLSTKSQVEWS